MGFTFKLYVIKTRESFITRRDYSLWEIFESKVENSI